MLGHMMKATMTINLHFEDLIVFIFIYSLLQLTSQLESRGPTKAELKLRDKIQKLEEQLNDKRGKDFTRKAQFYQRLFNV